MQGEGRAGLLRGRACAERSSTSSSSRLTPPSSRSCLGQRTRLVQDRQHVCERGQDACRWQLLLAGARDRQARPRRAVDAGPGIVEVMGDAADTAGARRRRIRDVPKRRAGAALVARAARVQVPGRGRDRSVARALGSGRPDPEHRDIRDGFRAARGACSGPLLLGGHAARRRQASRRPVRRQLVQRGAGRAGSTRPPSWASGPRRQRRGLRPPAHVGADRGCRSLRRRDQHRAQPRRRGQVVSRRLGRVLLGPVTGTSLSPAKVLPNNTGSGVPGDPEQFGYWWRVRGVDPDGNSGEWNYGRPFDKTYPASIAGLHVRDNLADVADRSRSRHRRHRHLRAGDRLAAGSRRLELRGPRRAVCAGSRDLDLGVQLVLGGLDSWDVSPRRPDGPRSETPAPTSRPASSRTCARDRRRASAQAGSSYCARVKARRDRDAKGKES